MSELISGKEALIALANGEEVQIECNKQWVSVENCQVYQFLYKNCNYKFRIKPHTIAINGIEVPAPFDPKDGDEFWILFESHYSPCGYKLVLPDSQYSELCYGAWRTEDEIKQVVEALRQVFDIRQILTEDKFI